MFIMWLGILGFDTHFNAQFRFVSGLLGNRYTIFIILKQPVKTIIVWFMWKVNTSTVLKTVS